MPGIISLKSINNFQLSSNDISGLNGAPSSLFQEVLAAVDFKRSIENNEDNNIVPQRRAPPPPAAPRNAEARTPLANVVRAKTFSSARPEIKVGVQYQMKQFSKV